MPSIAANGINFNYRLDGPADAPVIAFVHALGASLDMWREQVALLSSRYRCLSYDANGHGQSSERIAEPAIASFADDLAALLSALDIVRAHVVGASLGGMTAQSFAVRHPDKLDRLVLVGTTAKMPDPAGWRERADKVRADGVGDLAQPAMERWFTAEFASHDAARVAETRRIFEATRPDAYILACQAIAAMDLTGDLGKITAPTMVMAAEHDPATPSSMALEIRDRVPGATMVVIPHAAHIMAIEAAPVVAAWIGTFLELDG